MTDPQQGSTAPAVPPQSFAALRHPGYRAYFFFGALAMMADAIEHVITYWIIFQKFHSPALGGFAILSHWLPFLFFAMYSGSLADRFDPRRIIQIGMLLFMAASIAWGLLLLFGTLEQWHAMVLLVVHGCAGVLWHPSGQVLIHDIVGTAHLQSAVRLGATSRYLGLLAGPAVGAAILLVFGPAYGLFFNALIYLPLVFWLWKAPYGPRFRKEKPFSRAVKGFRDVVQTIRDVAANPTLASMTLLAGTASLLLGNGYHAQMPEFAHDLGHGDPGLSYGALLAADAAGALTAGLVLESRSMLQAKPRTAIVLAMLWCCAVACFAASPWYGLSLVLLFTVGFLELAFYAMAQTLVQLRAPSQIRGRVIGVYQMSSLGMRAFSGVTIGVGGGLIGIHWSLSLSAIALLVILTGLLVYTLRASPARAAAGD